MTKIVKLRVIPPPKEGTRTVFTTHDKDALVKWVDLESLVCGNCANASQHKCTYGVVSLAGQC